MPIVREYELALERNPADTEAFVALRKTYRHAKEHDKLITLYETRAQAIEPTAPEARSCSTGGRAALDKRATRRRRCRPGNACTAHPSHIGATR